MVLRKDFSCSLRCRRHRHSGASAHSTNACRVTVTAGPTLGPLPSRGWHSDGERPAKKHSVTWVTVLSVLIKECLRKCGKAEGSVGRGPIRAVA